MNTFNELGRKAAEGNRPRAVDLDAEFCRVVAELDSDQKRDEAAKAFYQGYDALIYDLVCTALEKAAGKRTATNREPE